MTLAHRTTAFVPTLALLVTVLSCSGERDDDADALAAALVTRAAEFELDTEWQLASRFCRSFRTSAFGSSSSGVRK